MRLKKLMCVALVSVMIGGLVACGSDNNATNNVGVVGTQSQTEANDANNEKQSSNSQNDDKGSDESNNLSGKEWTTAHIYEDSVLDLVKDCKDVDNSNITWHLFTKELKGKITLNDLLSDSTGKAFSLDDARKNGHKYWDGFSGEDSKPGESRQLSFSNILETGYGNHTSGIIDILQTGKKEENFSLQDSMNKNYWMITINKSSVMNSKISKVLNNPDAKIDEELFLNIMGKPDYITLGWGVDRRNATDAFGTYVYGKVDEYFNKDLSTQWIYCVYEFDGFKFIIAALESNFRVNGEKREARCSFTECYLISDEAYNDCTQNFITKKFTDSVKVWSKEEGYLFDK